MILGLDISTSVVGACWLHDDGSFHLANYCDLRKVKGSLLEKAAVFSQWYGIQVASMLATPDHVFIEDKLSGFAGGRTRQQVLMKLGAFNGMVSWIVHSRNSYTPEPVYIHPSTAKASMKRDGLVIPKGGDKKKLTLDFVCENISEFPYEETRNGNPQAFCYDMADAYTIARTGYIKHVCT